MVTIKCLLVINFKLQRITPMSSLGPYPKINQSLTASLLAYLVLDLCNYRPGEHNYVYANDCHLVRTHSL